MSERKRKKIEEKLEMIEQRLRNAKEYVAKNVNVLGSSLLHFDDWRGKSGHPSWMRHFMIPTLMKGRARKERALENMDNKTKDRSLTSRRRCGARRAREV